MSTLKLNAEFKDARKLGRCYTSIKVDDINKLFIDVPNGSPSRWYGYDYTGSTEITIDTSAHQPCIYACMKHKIDVEIEWTNGISSFSEEYTFNDLESTLEVFKLMENLSIKSIKILDLDKMEGVEVEE